jgi:hypothetical protein
MTSFNPYYGDEAVTQNELNSNYFGLISNTEGTDTELHGYDVTMSGRLVLPVLNPQSDNAEQGKPITRVC